MVSWTAWIAQTRPTVPPTGGQGRVRTQGTSSVTTVSVSTEKIFYAMGMMTAGMNPMSLQSVVGAAMSTSYVLQLSRPFLVVWQESCDPQELGWDEICTFSLRAHSKAVSTIGSDISCLISNRSHMIIGR